MDFTPLTDRIDLFNHGGTMKLEIPESFHDFLQPAFIKCAYGGRSSSKSQSFIRLLLVKMMEGKSIGCFREVEKSIKNSIKTSFDTVIDQEGWRTYFSSTDTYIRCNHNNAMMMFSGLRNATNIKGMDHLDIFFMEEAESVSDESLKVILPTARKPGAEVWIAFNPRNMTDPVYKMIVGSPPPEYVKGSNGDMVRYSIIKKVNYYDNPWFPESSRLQMLEMKKNDHDLYLHVWEGEPIRESELAIIKPLWIDAAKNAHLHPEYGHLFAPNGNRFCGLDPADEGEDFNAKVYRDNQTIYQVDEWKDRDPVAVGQRVYLDAISDGVTQVSYDNIGVGAGVKGKFREMEDELIRAGSHNELIQFTEFTASASPASAESEYMPGRNHGDHFLNAKAQGWWLLRDRFHNTYKLIVEGKDVDTEKLISIDTSCMDMRKFDKLKGELSSPNREYSNGKIKVESKDSLKKRGISSPNMADAVVMAFDPNFEVGYSWDAW